MIDKCSRIGCERQPIGYVMDLNLCEFHTRFLAWMAKDANSLEDAVGLFKIACILEDCKI